MTDNVTSTSAAVEPEKVTKEEETEVIQTPTPKETEDDPIENGTLEKRSISVPYLFNWNARYFAFGTSETKYSVENLRQYYKKTRRTIRQSHGSPSATSPEETPAEEGAKTSTAAATEASGETSQVKNDDPKRALHALCANIAHASQTGKGLLFYYKSSDHTNEPHGIINLKFVKEVKECGTSGKAHEFKIITEYREYVLKAENETTKKRWIKTIQAKAQEAKEYPLPETEEYKSVYDQVCKLTQSRVVSQERFLKEGGGVTSDSENYTSGEDTEVKSKRKYLSFIGGRRPEKTAKTEKTEATTTTTNTTTINEIAEIVEESGEKPPERRPSLFFTNFFGGGKKSEKDKEIKESVEETVVAETSTAAETKVEVVNTETTIDKVEKVEASPTVQKFSFKKFFSRSTSEPKVEAAEQTVLETAEIVAEETAEGATKVTEETTKAIEETVVTEEATKVTEETTKAIEEVAEKITDGAENPDEEADKVDIKPESSNPKKATAGIFRRVTQVFKRTIVDDSGPTRDVPETAAGSSTEKEETEDSTKEVSKKRLSKQTQPVQPEEVEPETQPTTTTIESAADATDNKESENLVLKKIESPRKYGQLDKLTKRKVNLRKTYKPRYFVFTQEGTLNYYTSEKDESEPKKIPITHEVKITKVEDKQTEFEIDTKSKGYKLVAPSETERNEWITVLEDYRKSLPVTDPSSSKAPEKKVEEVQTEATETKEIVTEKIEEIVGETVVKTEVEITEVKSEVKSEEKTLEITEEKTVVITEKTKEITEEKPEKEIEEKPAETVEEKPTEVIEEKTTVETSTTSDEKQ
ncbi:16729_t:CDS:2 [Acaulospora morrowiae]|uniref:16729_t:CDS:1 n=1 Tax=Acaulospora morrowiae TaxID=94023 RepID=A0A9N9BJ27_9GLOM|nr:16729_t:CDS:2 [Acaulospora morrowiae]